MSLGLDSLGTASLGLGGELPRTEYGFLLFDFTPNTERYLDEVIQYATEVVESFNGIEQRQAKLVKPRMAYAYSTVQLGTRARLLDAFLYGFTHQTYAVPVWTDQTVLTAATDGGTELYFDYSDRAFTENGYFVLYHSPERYEFGRIATFDTGYARITESTFYAWPAGSKIYPINFAQLGADKTVWLNTLAANTPVKLDFLASNLSFNLPVVAPAVVYDGLEVLEIRHNWMAEFSFEHDFGFEVLDNGYGVIDRRYFKSHTRVTRPLKWLLNTREKMQFFRAFIQRRRGKLVPFWLARNVDDFTLINNVSSTDINLVVGGTAFANYVGLAKGRDHISITLQSGVKLYAQIESVNVQSGNTILTLSDEIGTAFTASQVVQFASLLKCRLASDKVTINWKAVDVAEAETYFVSLI